MLTTSIFPTAKGLENRVKKLETAVSREKYAFDNYGPTADAPSYAYSAKHGIIRKANRRVVSTIDYFGKLKNRIDRVKNVEKREEMQKHFDAQAVKFVKAIDESRYEIMPMDVRGQTTVSIPTYPASIERDAPPYFPNIVMNVHRDRQHALLEVAFTSLVGFTLLFTENLMNGTITNAPALPPIENLLENLRQFAHPLKNIAEIANYPITVITAALTIGVMLYTMVKFPGKDGVGKRTQKTQDSLKVVCESGKSEQFLSTVN